jgi:hypothetical protein
VDVSGIEPSATKDDGRSYVSEEKPLELRVSVDVGYRRHNVAIGLSSGEVLEEFEIETGPRDFKSSFLVSRSTTRKSTVR